MVILRWYQMLRWVGWHLLRPLQLKDRWGFNLGEDLEEWAMVRAFSHVDRVNEASGFELRTVNRPIGWYCEHMTMTSANLTAAPVSWCGCKMRPLFRDRTTATTVGI